jgi:hypothetical protein
MKSGVIELTSNDIDKRMLIDFLKRFELDYNFEIKVNVEHKLHKTEKGFRDSDGVPLEPDHPAYIEFEIEYKDQCIYSYLDDASDIENQLFDNEYA